jgi:hypothetical protein
MLISIMDREIERMLKREGRIVIKVTAAYDTTVCGYYGEKFITILNRRKSILPVSVVALDEITGRKYMPGDFITISRNYHDDFTAVDTTNIVDLAMPAAEGLGSVEEKYRSIHAFLSTLDIPLYGMLPIISRMESSYNNQPSFEKDLAMKTYIMEQILLMLSGIKENQNITAKNIIGYGVGLTPSADDYLLGMLSVFDHYNEITKRSILSEYIKKYSHTTTEVSGWMLKYGSEKKLYPHIVIDYFIQNAGVGNFPADFLKHGSSSGIDMLCGMYCGLNILRRGDS